MQPVEAKGIVLGVIALVNLEVIEATGKSLEIPCHVLDSTKPVWQGDVKNCGMIMGTNALVAFEFCISHANGTEISPVSAAKQLESTDLVKPVEELSKQTCKELSKQTCSPICLTDPDQCYRSVQVQTPSLTELVTLPKVTKTELDASQLLTDLVILPKRKRVSATKIFVVVLKHNVQIMPGITK